MVDFATKIMADLDDDDHHHHHKVDNWVYVNDTSIVMMNKPDGRFCNKNNG